MQSCDKKPRKKSVVLCSTSQSVGVSLMQSEDESFWFVCNVERGSLAHSAGVEQGDYLHSINFKQIQSDIQVKHELGQRPPIVLQFVSAPFPFEAEQAEEISSQDGHPTLPMLDKEFDGGGNTIPSLVTDNSRRIRVLQGKQEMQRVAAWLHGFANNSLPTSGGGGGIGAKGSSSNSIRSRENPPNSRPVVIVMEEEAAGGEILACCIGYLLKGSSGSTERIFLVQDLIVSPRGIEDEANENVGGELFDWIVQHAREHWKDCAEIQLCSDLQASEAHRFFIGKGMNLFALAFSLRL